MPRKFGWFPLRHGAVLLEQGLWLHGWSPEFSEMPKEIRKISPSLS